MKYNFFSIIIPVYNGEKYITNCLDSLENLNYPRNNYEVIIVDNNSTDKGIELAKIRTVKIVSEEQKGSYAARNKGISVAEGGILAFTDVDCQVDWNWLIVANEHLERTEDEVLSGPVEFLDQDNLNIWGKCDRNRFLKQDRYYQRSGAATANLFVKRKVFDEVGLFDYNLQSGGDTSWVNKASNEGATFGYNPNLKVYHPVRNSFSELKNKCYRVGYGKGQLAKKKGELFFLVDPKHLSPGYSTLKNTLGEGSLVDHLKMLPAIYLLNLVEHLGKLKGFISSKRAKET